MSKRRQNIYLYSDVSGVYGENENLLQMKLAFVIVCPHSSFVYMKKCFLFSAENCDNTGYGEALACLFGLYYFLEYFDSGKFRPVCHIDNTFVQAILTKSKNKQKEKYPDVVEELERIQHRTQLGIVMVKGKKNKAHAISRKCEIV